MTAQPVHTEGLKTIPTVRELPLIGSLLALQKDPLALVQRVARECDNVGQFHLGPLTNLVFNTPETVHGVLVEHVDHFDKGALTLHAYKTIGQTPVLIREGAAHRQERAILNPIFHPRHLARYAGTMATYAERTQQGWPDGTIVDIQGEMMALTLRIMGKVLLDIDALTVADDEAAAITAIAEYLAHGVRSPLLLPLIVPTPSNMRMRRALIVLRQRLGAAIEARKRGDATRHTDFLSQLAAARDEHGAALSAAQLRDDAVEIFNAGYENVGATLSWLVYLLADHPDIAARVQQETDGVLGGRPATYDDLAQLPYTLQVVKETLRLYPPIYIFSPRRALRDLVIDGFPVRKGQMVLISPYAMHHRPDYYPEPARFDPDRFSPSQEAARPRYTFMPFNAGPHMCAGHHFALMELHLIAATLVQRVGVTLVPGQHIVPQPGVVLRQAQGCRVVIRRRGEPRNAHGTT